MRDGMDEIRDGKDGMRDRNGIGDRDEIDEWIGWVERWMG
jgi:hypothetical protein